MSTILLENRAVIPDRVRDLPTFRRWMHSAEFPAEGQYAWLDGRLWADFSMEELFTHNQLKAEFVAVLRPLAQQSERFYFLTDGMLLTNDEANLSTEPDGMLVSFAAIEEGRVRLVKRRRGYTEVEGSPEMALEIVSDSSVQKDTRILRELYHRAGVQEYWLVDVRHRRTRPLRSHAGDRAVRQVRFQILRHTPDGYVEAEKDQQWIQSDVLGMSFRLKRSTDRLGHPQFSLQSR